MVEARPVEYKALELSAIECATQWYSAPAKVRDNVFFNMARSQYLAANVGLPPARVKKRPIPYKSAMQHRYIFIDGKAYTENAVGERIDEKHRLDTRRTGTCVCAAVAVSISEMVQRLTDDLVVVSAEGVHDILTERVGEEGIEVETLI